MLSKGKVSPWALYGRDACSDDPASPVEQEVQQMCGEVLMDTPIPTGAAVPIVGAIGYGSIAFAGVIVSNIAAATGLPLPYYAVLVGGVAFIFSIIRFWAWVQDRNKKELNLTERRMRAELVKTEERLTKSMEDHFTAHNALDEERHRRLECMIQALGRDP